MTEAVESKRPQDAQFEVPEAKKQHVEEKHDHFAKGMAPIKPEFIVSVDVSKSASYNDDEAETGERNNDDHKSKRKNKKKGQNKNREVKQNKEEIRLCPVLIDPEDSNECTKEKCRNTHNIEEYLAQKPKDNEGTCPVFEAIGYCPSGLKCRWLKSHYNHETKKLIKDLDLMTKSKESNYEVNKLKQELRFALQRNRYELGVSKEIIKELDIQKNITASQNGASMGEIDSSSTQDETKEKMASYIEQPFKISEKKKLDLRGAKIVSPLTTVGNLPYRRLMKTLGADVTYCEMALATPLMQGTNAEWALPKAHVSEYPGFGIQIATNQYSASAKVAEIISRETTHVSELNLNSGCPIDLLYKQGQGSALMDQPTKLVRILKSMNASSGDIPVTLKIRTGTRDNKNTAKALVERVLSEGDTAAITLHGRSRQQRYTKQANWDYIGEVGKVVQDWNNKKEDDKERSDIQRTNFIGNGDVYNFEDWHNAVNTDGIDSVMVARGALIKPWIFEEVESQQYLDKSSKERLEILRNYSNFALEHWGSDEYGVALARRFLCEFMSFTHRYIPVGILEKLPAKLNQRPPQWKGRDDLETLLGSDNYKDWIKISEMFLGKAGDNFQFIPKHKSNSYE